MTTIYDRVDFTHEWWHNLLEDKDECFCQWTPDPAEEAERQQAIDDVLAGRRSMPDYLAEVAPELDQTVS